MTQRRRKYATEFKQEAVQLAERVGAPQASVDLGIPYDNIRRWVQQTSNSGKGTSSGPSKEELEAETRRLRKENGYLKKINEVLKKSTAIFSKDHIGDLK